MAKNIIALQIDATEAIKLFMAGYEAMFISMTDFSELESICNQFKIDLNEH